MATLEVVPEPQPPKQYILTMNEDECQLVKDLLNNYMDWYAPEWKHKLWCTLERGLPGTKRRFSIQQISGA